MTARENSL